MTVRLCTVLLLTALGVASFPAAGEAWKDNPKCQAHPLFSRFANSIYRDCEQARFKSIALKRFKDPSNPKSPVEDFAKEGEHWYLKTILNEDSSGRYPGPLEVLRNYENAVQEAKGTILFTQSGAARLHYRIGRPDGEYWGTVYCDGVTPSKCPAIVHNVVRIAAMEQSVVVSAEQIAKGMGDDGKVVFYGILFDTDKATIRAESSPTLIEMAKWLTANPNTKVFIVGHTDMQGSADHNQKLSRDRAAAAVAILAKDHGIKADRLAAEGVGPLAPVASNTSESGRSKNRRVEMVLR